MGRLRKCERALVRGVEPGLMVSGRVQRNGALLWVGSARKRGNALCAELCSDYEARSALASSVTVTEQL